MKTKCSLLNITLLLREQGEVRTGDIRHVYHVLFVILVHSGKVSDYRPLNDYL